MSSLEIFVWAIAGGTFVMVLSIAAAYSQKDTISKKQMSRDFLLGAAFTGFVYPLIPDTFSDIQCLVTSTAGDIQSSIVSVATSGASYDPGVQVGPANF